LTDPEGYERWNSLLESGKADEFAVPYNVAEFAEGRRFAVEFLEEAKTQLGSELSLLFDEAIKQYRLAAENSRKMSNLFPHDVSAIQRAIILKDQQRRQSAIQHLRAAKDAEIEGLKALARIVEKL